MNFSLKIARRYLFSKSSATAINVISGISIFGVSVGAAALLLTLSVFNGFEDLLSRMIGRFNPDLKITAAKGKFFAVDTAQLTQIKSLKGVQVVCEAVEEVAFLEYASGQDFGILKGVDTHFSIVTGIDSTIREGIFEVGGGETTHFAVVGGGIRNRLGVDVESRRLPLSIYMPKRGEVGTLEQPFKKRFATPVGTFVVQQELDDKYVITNLELIREMLDLEQEVTSLEIKLLPDAPNNVANEIQKILGKDIIIKNRYEQDASVLKIVNIEKWMSYAICFLLISLIAFNMVGALWMMVLDKKQDISILRAMGANDKMIRRIFLNEGLLFCFWGFIFGTGVAVILYLVHTRSASGIFTLPEGFMVDRYPIAMRWTDFIVTAATVGIIGLFASLPAASRAVGISGFVRED